MQTLTREMPVFDHVPDEVYQLTDVPDSIEQGRAYWESIKSEITDLQLKRGYEYPQVAHRFEDYKAYLLWHKQIVDMLRVRQLQSFLLKNWLRENSAFDSSAKSFTAQPATLSNLRREIRGLRFCFGKLSGWLMQKYPNDVELALILQELAGQSDV